MARFKYMGEPSRPLLVVSYGPCECIKVPLKNGTTQVINPPGGAPSFVIGDDIGTTITDERSLRSLRADTRFQEI